MSRLDFLVFCFGWCPVGGALCRTQWGSGCHVSDTVRLGTLLYMTMEGEASFWEITECAETSGKLWSGISSCVGDVESMDVRGNSQPWSYGCSSVRDTGASIATRLMSTLRLRQKWLPFCRQHIQINFLVWKLLWFDSNFTEICSHRSNHQWTGIGCRLAIFITAVMAHWSHPQLHSLDVQ